MCVCVCVCVCVFFLGERFESGFKVFVWEYEEFPGGNGGARLVLYHVTLFCFQASFFSNPFSRTLFFLVISFLFIHLFSLSFSVCVRFSHDLSHLSVGYFCKGEGHCVVLSPLNFYLFVCNANNYNLNYIECPAKI